MDDKKLNSKPRVKEEVSDPTLKKVLDKIADAESVLVALSNDPTVDEIAAAMGLSMVLDLAGKHVTAIYSGKTPNVLQFLKPEERFETGTESLQDFVIALNKDKADHLRYKIDGDFVKVYVTPYKTTISGDDIEFSRGDYNVDLVISLNVPAATEFDAALKEHGRIMHDASSVNITNGAAGKFGDVEWVDEKASSISEMVAKLAFGLGVQLDAATATALLTGLVAATDRFKNPATTPDAMVLAAKLMGAGADQQLVVQNVQGEVVFDGSEGGKSMVLAGAGAEAPAEATKEAEDAAKLDIAHGKEATEESVKVEGPEPEAIEESAKVEEREVTEGPVKAEEVGTTSVGQEMDSVKAAMAEALSPMGAPAGAPAENTVAGVEVAVAPGGAGGYAGGSMADQILNNIEKEKSNVGATDYGKMIDEALDEPLPGEGGIQVGQEGLNGPQVNTQDVDKVDVPQGNPMAGVGVMPVASPVAPAVNEEEDAMKIIKAAQTEANAPLAGAVSGGELPKIVPTGGSLGYEAPVGSETNPMMGNGIESSAMPMPGQEVLPPPVLPTPDFGAMPPSVEPVGTGVAEPVSSPVPDVSVGVDAGLASVPTVDAAGLPQMPQVVGVPQAPVMQALGNEAVGMQTGVGNFQSQEQISNSMNNDGNSSDPSAFKIPGIHT